MPLLEVNFAEPPWYGPVRVVWEGKPVRASLIPIGYLSDADCRLYGSRQPSMNSKMVRSAFARVRKPV